MGPEAALQVENRVDRAGRYCGVGSHRPHHRNVRMATVIGIVGAGGIGQELKGRYEMFHYGHVGTILLVLFLTVMLLDQFSARIRGKLIA